jgi:hypothetical protein
VHVTLRAYVLLTVLESNYESTFIEPPETPAHQFAVKAFKHAIFGTPAPEDAKDASKKSERKAKLDIANGKAIDLPAPKENGPPVSPSKQPGGILMTPGTASKGRKQVSFGSHVVDNEGKRGNPSIAPGSFLARGHLAHNLRLTPTATNGLELGSPKPYWTRARLHSRNRGRSPRQETTATSHWTWGLRALIRADTGKSNTKATPRKARRR